MTERKPKAPKTSPTFEEAVTEVEEIISKIESGEMGLEDQIEQYARGAELLKVCREILGRCEQRVEQIAADLGAKPGAAPAGSGAPDSDT